MTYRKIVSLSIAISFTVLMVTGVLSFFTEYTRKLATVHTIFGLIFAIGAILHFANNLLPIKRYSKGILPIIILLLVGSITAAAYFEILPLKKLMDVGARSKAQSGQSLSQHYEHIQFALDRDIQLSIDLLRAEHFWHPQIAIWLEDSSGNYLETLLVTKATAKGIFAGGRTKDNFKTFDAQKVSVGGMRRVDALPVWSHARGIRYADGMFSPPPEEPLADAITSATPLDNFRFETSCDAMPKFVIKLEINVAFDDNEYYSEYDFANDTIFHNGTGQLGQPSLVYAKEVDLSDGQNYYLMDLLGHGHHSGQTGQLYDDLSHMTTALEIVERIVLGVKGE